MRGDPLCLMQELIVRHYCLSWSQRLSIGFLFQTFSVWMELDYISVGQLYCGDLFSRGGFAYTWQDMIRPNFCLRYSFQVYNRSQKGPSLSLIFWWNNFFLEWDSTDNLIESDSIIFTVDLTSQHMMLFYSINLITLGWDFEFGGIYEEIEKFMMRGEHYLLFTFLTCLFTFLLLLVAKCLSSYESS